MKKRVFVRKNNCSYVKFFPPEMSNMAVIGITSGMQCGKSTVAGFFRNKGFYVVDADKVVSALYRDKKIKRRLLKEFKTSDKKKISGIAFSNKRKMNKLNRIFWPEVRKEIKARIRKSKRKKIVLDVPMLFESGLDKLCDYVVVVSLPKSKQVERVMRKSHIPKFSALKRIGMQMPLNKKIKKADFVVDNGKSRADARKQIRGIIKSV